MNVEIKFQLECKLRGPCAILVRVRVRWLIRAEPSPSVYRKGSGINILLPAVMRVHGRSPPSLFIIIVVVVIIPPLPSCHHHHSYRDYRVVVVVDTMAILIIVVIIMLLAGHDYADRYHVCVHHDIYPPLVDLILFTRDRLDRMRHERKSDPRYVHLLKVRSS